MTLVIAGLALTALAGFVWRAADRLWHAIAIAALAVVFLPLVAGTPAGDVSRILPADSLPSFFPGHEAGVMRLHVKHGIVAGAAGAVLLMAGWFMGRR